MKKLRRRYIIGDTVKIIDVGRMFSGEAELAKKLKATTWERRTPFNKKLEGELAEVKNLEDCRVDPRYLIELCSNGDQYVIGGSGIKKSDRLFLTDDLFEI